MRFLFLFLLLPSAAYSQNLLVNGGFEKENVCTEYKVRCAPEAWIYSVPSFIHYFTDATQAYKGERYVALIAGHSRKPYYRSFIRTPLLCGLRRGNEYRLKLFVRSRHPLLDSIGIYFTPYDFLFEKAPYQSLQPALYLADAVQKPVTHDTGWQKMVLYYVATGAEAYLTIGNFSRLDRQGSTGIDRENNFFFLVDEVSLVPTDAKEQRCSDWMQRQKSIVAQTERHEYQVRLVKEHKSLPYKNIALPPTTMQMVDTLVVPDVLFATNEAALTEQADGALLALLQQLHTKQLDSVVVEGHTDSTGTTAINEALSLDRARQVAHFLQQQLGLTTVTISGWGSRKPVANNHTPEGRQKNRRVEIYVYLKE